MPLRVAADAIGYLPFSVMDAGASRLLLTDGATRKQVAFFLAVATFLVAGTLALIFVPSSFGMSSMMGSGPDLPLNVPGGGTAGYGHNPPGAPSPAPLASSSSTATSTPTSSSSESSTSAAPRPPQDRPAPRPPRPNPGPAGPPVPSDTTALRGELRRLVNDTRSANGCGALQVDPRLQNAAQQNSDEPAGLSPQDQANGAGFPGSTFDELTAKGQTAANQVLQTWLNSASDKRILVDCQYRFAGFGLGDGFRWTLLMAA
ncbi:CAP domain-containing protein [Pseudonocardiaceae bacterium YIM PH 21723]|nr:CAP domain-containing protein [Pseudonocardiaceae bacterium YIM PH 21723]